MVTVNMVATGANIKNMMKARNIKVKDVQAVCGFGTPQAIFKWMRGDCMPTIDNMIIIADMFGCTMDDIVVVDKQISDIFHIHFQEQDTYVSINVEKV